MKKNILLFSIALLTSLAFSMTVTAARAQDQKPTPDPEAEEILKTLDCAGSFLSGEKTFYTRLRPSSDSQARIGFKIDVASDHPKLPEQLVVGGYGSNTRQFVVTGSEPLLFILNIDRFGVHGAHNAYLNFPQSTIGETFLFECYFY